MFEKRSPNDEINPPGFNWTYSCVKRVMLDTPKSFLVLHDVSFSLGQRSKIKVQFQILQKTKDKFQILVKDQISTSNFRQKTKDELRILAKNEKSTRNFSQRSKIICPIQSTSLHVALYAIILLLLLISALFGLLKYIRDLEERSEYGRGTVVELEISSVAFNLYTLGFGRIYVRKQCEQLPLFHRLQGLLDYINSGMP